MANIRRSRAKYRKLQNSIRHWEQMYTKFVPNSPDAWNALSEIKLAIERKNDELARLGDLIGW